MSEEEKEGLRVREKESEERETAVKHGSAQLWLLGSVMAVVTLEVWESTFSLEGACVCGCVKKCACVYVSQLCRVAAVTLSLLLIILGRMHGGRKTGKEIGNILG